MSRKSRKHNRPAAAQSFRAVPPGTPRKIQAPRPQTPYHYGQYPGMNQFGANTMPVSAYQPFQSAGNLVMPPGDPIRPSGGLDDGSGGPRQWPYPVGINIVPVPRSTESTSFEQLRNLAAMYDGVQLCEMAIERILSRLEAHITPKVGVVPDDEATTDDKWAEPAKYMMEWFQEPDHRGTDLTSWMIAGMNDIDEIDALGIYHRQTRGGGLYGLELVAGDSLALLVDSGGRLPIPPAPAYYQISYGVPGVLISANEMDYLKVRSRTNSRYGRSPVEAILLDINTALRKKSYDLRRFTDGSTPQGVLETQNPALLNMKPQDVQIWEQMWNAVLAGNETLRVRTKAVPPGWTFKNLQIEDIATSLDEYLLNITVAAWGLTKDELGFTDTSNRSVGQMQENVVYRNAVKPRSDFFARYFTRVIARYDGTPISPVNATISLPGKATKSKQGYWDARYAFGWSGIEEPEDFKAKSDAISTLVQRGVIGPSKAQKILKIPQEKGEPNIPAFVTVNGQGIVFLEDALAMREFTVQEAKNRAIGTSGPGLGTPALSASTGTDTPSIGPVGGRGPDQPGGPPAGGGREPDNNPGGSGSARPTGGQGGRFGGGSAVPPGGTDKPSASQPTSGSAGKSSTGANTRSSERASARRTGDPHHAAAGSDGERVSARLGPATSAATVERQVREVSAADVSKEWRRYRDATLKALKRGRSVPDFQTEILPALDHTWVAARLERCTTPDEARTVFAAQRQREALRAAGHTSIMVALPLPPALAEQLALEDGEDASKLHLTLAMLGHQADYSPDRLCDLWGVISQFAASHSTLSGTISGIGRFNAEGDVEPVYASADVPNLPPWRQELVDTLEDAGFGLDQTHGMSPHITLAYVAKDDPNPIDSIPTLPITFDRLLLAIGDDQHTFTLGQAPARSATTNRARQPHPVGRLTKEQMQRLEVPRAVTKEREALAAKALAFFYEVGNRGYQQLRQ